MSGLPEDCPSILCMVWAPIHPSLPPCRRADDLESSEETTDGERVEGVRRERPAEGVQGGPEGEKELSDSQVPPSPRVS